jgi:hypothetical protein
MLWKDDKDNPAATDLLYTMARDLLYRDTRLRGIEVNIPNVFLPSYKTSVEAYTEQLERRCSKAHPVSLTLVKRGDALE